MDSPRAVVPVSVKADEEEPQRNCDDLPSSDATPLVSSPDCCPVTSAPSASASAQFYPSLTEYSLELKSPSPAAAAAAAATAAEVSLAFAEPSTAAMTFLSSFPVISAVSSSPVSDAEAPETASSAATSSCDATEASTVLTPALDPSQPMTLSETSTFSADAEMISALCAGPLAHSSSIALDGAPLSSDGAAREAGVPTDLTAPLESSVAAPLRTSSSDMEAVHSSAGPIERCSVETPAEVQASSAVTENPDLSSSNSPALPSIAAPEKFPPSYTVEELSTLRVPLQAILENPNCESPPLSNALEVPLESTLENPNCESLPMPNGRVSYSSDLSVTPVGASIGVSTERSPLVSPTTLPSGTSTIVYPSLISDLPTTQPSHSLCKLPDPFSVPSVSSCGPIIARSKSLVDRHSNLSLIIPKLEPSFPSDSVSSYSTAKSCNFPLSLAGVPVSSPSSSSSSPHMPSNANASPSSPSYTFLDHYDSKNLSLQSAAVSSSWLDSAARENTVVSTSVAPSTCAPSSASLFSTTLTSPPPELANGLLSMSGEPMDCSPSPASLVMGDSSNLECVPPTSSGNLGPSSSDRRFQREHRFSLGPPPLPSSEIIPRRPVREGKKGSGWPYAPEGWPNGDDKWLWRVGKKGVSSGFFKDRFLGLPRSLGKGKKPIEFASKRGIVGYLKQNFPHVNVDTFFESFQWRVPYVSHRNSLSAGDLKANIAKRQRSCEEDEDFQTSGKRSRKQCKAGNSKCGLETGRSTLLGPIPCLNCDVCCVEPGFCRECNCILCCKTITPDIGECNLIRCLQRPPGGGICGHGAHLECALKAQMAGVVKRSGLDMEYLCRRCDKKTDLRELVTRLLEAVGNTALRAHAEKSLQLALQIMQGTEHGGNGARVLESLVQTALRKVQNGVDIQDVFSDLRDQGIAAEAAKQQSLGRGLSTGEDVTQQPEASLDQWLPSSGSPTSHPSPGTPSSFTSPVIRSNPSVNSGLANGLDSVEVCDDKHTMNEAQTDDIGEPYSTPGISKPSNLASKSLTKNVGHIIATLKALSGSSNVDSAHEAMCDSQTVKNFGHHTSEEPDTRDGNSGTKKLIDHRSPKAGLYREEPLFAGICKSCGAKRQTSNGLEVTSSLKHPKIEDGGNRFSQSSSIRRNGEPGKYGTPKSPSGNEAEPGSGGQSHASAAEASLADGSGRQVMGISLQTLDARCQQEVHTVLQKLRQAQDAEYARAQECLTAQKGTVLKQYELLEITRKEFTDHPFSSSLQSFDELMQKTAMQFTKAQKERESFESMMKVAGGFANLSREELSKFYC